MKKLQLFGHQSRSLWLVREHLQFRALLTGSRLQGPRGVVWPMNDSFTPTPHNAQLCQLTLEESTN